MISERTGLLIAILLAAILAVLVFGREAVAPFLLPIGIGSLVVFLIVIGAGRFSADFIDMLLIDQKSGGSPLLLGVAFIGLAANIAIIGTSSFKEILSTIPWFWVPMAVFMGCYCLNEALKFFGRSKN
jgi:hypothetical protein